MKAILATIIFTLILCENIQADEYYKVDGRAYYVSHPLTDNWHQAFRHCRQLGMNLIDVRTEDESVRVIEIMESFRKTHNSNGGINYWTSGTDLGSEGTFYWMSTGRALEFTKFSPGQPDNYLFLGANETENCVQIKGLYYNEWNDAGCSIKLPFICRDFNDVPILKP